MIAIAMTGTLLAVGRGLYSLPVELAVNSCVLIAFALALALAITLIAREEFSTPPHIDPSRRIPESMDRSNPKRDIAPSGEAERV
jgi:hypothetical protein